MLIHMDIETQNRIEKVIASKGDGAKYLRIYISGMG